MKTVLRLGALKRRWLDLRATLLFAVRPQAKWERRYVVFSPLRPKRGARPSRLDAQQVFATWPSLLRDLERSMPRGRPPHVVVYDFAPLHFPRAGATPPAGPAGPDGWDRQ